MSAFGPKMPSLFKEMPVRTLIPAIFCAASTLLSACATVTVDLAYAPEAEVCYYAASPQSNADAKRAAWNVIQARRIDCQRWNSLVMQRIAMDRQATVDMVNAWTRALTPPPAQPQPQTRNCTSSLVGGSVMTTCY